MQKNKLINFALSEYESVCPDSTFKFIFFIYYIVIHLLILYSNPYVLISLSYVAQLIGMIVLDKIIVFEESPTQWDEIAILLRILSLAMEPFFILNNRWNLYSTVAFAIMLFRLVCFILSWFTSPIIIKETKNGIAFECS